MAKKKRFYKESGSAKSFSQGFYAGPDARMRQEMEDAGMIHEDASQVANLPREVIMRPYPEVEGYSKENLDDTISGIDRQMSMDNRMKLKNLQPEKY